MHPIAVYFLKYSNFCCICWFMLYNHSTKEIIKSPKLRWHSCAMHANFWPQLYMIKDMLPFLFNSLAHRSSKVDLLLVFCHIMLAVSCTLNVTLKGYVMEILWEKSPGGSATRMFLLQMLKIEKKTNPSDRKDGRKSCIKTFDCYVSAKMPNRLPHNVI